MADRSPIEWTNATWNPVVGCSVISPGCTNCYAMKMAGRLELMGSPIYRGHTLQTKAGAVWNGTVAASNWGQVIKPLSWKKPRRVFVNSMSDLFHEGLPDATIDAVFAVMAVTGRHTYQVLTKRADRMRAYVTALGRDFDRLERAARDIGHTLKFKGRPFVSWPLPNIWLGVSVEDQQRADERIPELIETAAAIRFLSCEPLLGHVDLHDWISPAFSHPPQLDWIICGGESSRGARPMHPGWARSLRDQCKAADVPFFYKQWGEWAPDGVNFVSRNTQNEPGTISTLAASKGQYVVAWREQSGSTSQGDQMRRVGKKAAGRLLDGRTHDSFPDQVPA